MGLIFELKYGDIMRSKKITKVVGTISDEIVEKYKLYDYRNTKIVQSLDLYLHVTKHVPEFASVDSYNKTMSNIDTIIKNPYFVYYDSDRNSLLYFKEIKENVCVVVKLTLRKNKDSYVATVYPVSKQKIEKYIEQSYIIKGN